MVASTAVTHVVENMSVGGVADAVARTLRAAEVPPRLVVTGELGLRAVQCRPWLASLDQVQTTLALAERLCGAEVVHLHLDEPRWDWLLAASMAEPSLLMATLHHTRARAVASLVDFVVSPSEWAALGLCPARTEVRPHPLRATSVVPGLPWYRRGDGLRMVQVRQTAPTGAISAEALLATGLLDRFRPQVQILGSEGLSADSRVLHRGRVADVMEVLARADVLVRARPAEAFGRPVYQALAAGALPAVLPSPAHRAPSELVVELPASPQAAAELLRDELLQLAARPAVHAQRRERGRAWVQEQVAASVPPGVPAAAWRVAGVGRTLTAADVAEVDRALLCSMVDDLLRMGRPSRRGAGRDLGARGQAVWRWLRVCTGQAPPARRAALAEKALAVLGPRRGLLAAAAEAREGQGEDATHLRRLLAELRGVDAEEPSR